jgi:hypothetical protein
LRSDAAEQGDMGTALAHLTEIASETMRVERASVWRFSDDRSKLVLEDLYERTPDRHVSGSVLDALDKPRYFVALCEERCVAAHDARADGAHQRVRRHVPRAARHLVDARRADPVPG